MYHFYNTSLCSVYITRQCLVHYGFRELVRRILRGYVYRCLSCYRISKVQTAIILQRAVLVTIDCLVHDACSLVSDDPGRVSDLEQLN